MKRLLAISICVFMLISICACTPSGDVSTAQSTAESTGTTSSEESSNEGTKYSATIPDDFSWEKEEFKILTSWHIQGALKNYEFGYTTDELESSVISDAVETRNNIVEDKLGIEIVEDFVLGGRDTSSELVSYVQQSIDSGTGDFSAITPSLYVAGAIALQGNFYDLNDINNMSLESPWWDKYFIEETIIKDKVFFATGDFGFFTKNSLNAIFFNKQIRENLDLDDPYQLVKDNKWTIDTLTTWAKLYNEDLNNDGTITYLDQYGIGGQLDNIVTFFYSAGEMVSKLDDNGNPKLTAYNDRSATAMEKIQKLMSDPSFISANDLFGVSNQPVMLHVDAFISGRTFLFWDALLTIEGMRDMFDDFGILPLPLLDENQDRYHSLLNPYTGNAIGIAGNVDPSELEDIAVILNALGAEGKNFVTPAFTETTLKGQRLRDNDSEDMLDIIFDNIGCDIGFIYNFGNMAETVLHKIAKGENFTNLYDANKTRLENDIQNFIDVFESID